MMKILLIIYTFLLGPWLTFAQEEHNSPYIYLEAYPESVKFVDDNSVVLKSGLKINFDDGIIKSFEQKLQSADLEDQLSLLYPTGPNSFSTPAYNFDPGRFRNENIFRGMYGNSEEEVKKNLVQITWMPHTVGSKIWVTKINGVDKRLVAISNEFEALEPQLKLFVSTLGGTFNWRTISGTNQLSAHSFGIAIDINPKKGNYWKWDSQYNYSNSIPKRIVEIFEKHGFIWGGKWYHYDTMHFEFRPELLMSTKTREQ